MGYPDDHKVILPEICFTKTSDRRMSIVGTTVAVRSMESVFLAHSFNANDHELVGQVDRVISSHGLRSITGRNVGGGPLSPEIVQLIDRADALVALLTRREENGAGGWSSHPWVNDELVTARAKNKPAVAFVETGVKLGGAFSENERIDFDRGAPLEAFLRFSEMRGAWKERIGRTARVRLRPDKAAALAVNHGVQCKYRLLDERGEASEWMEGQVFDQAGGVFVYVRGIGDRHHLKVSLKGPNFEWNSPFEPFLMSTTLKKAGI